MDSLDGGNGSIRGAGCKHDGGPLWVSIPLLDDPVVANNVGDFNEEVYGYEEGGAYSQSLWARFF